MARTVVTAATLHGLPGDAIAGCHCHPTQSSARSTCKLNSSMKEACWVCWPLPAGGPWPSSCTTALCSSPPAALCVPAPHLSVGSRCMYGHCSLSRPPPAVQLLPCPSPSGAIQRRPSSAAPISSAASSPSSPMSIPCLVYDTRHRHCSQSQLPPALTALLTHTPPPPLPPHPAPLAPPAPTCLLVPVVGLAAGLVHYLRPLLVRGLAGGGAGAGGWRAAGAAAGGAAAVWLLAAAGQGPEPWARQRTRHVAAGHRGGAVGQQPLLKPERC